jgi:hypothetical protein
MRLDRLYQKLKAEQDALASSALRAPNARDSFEYGRVVGMYAGLEKAIAILVTLNNEEDDDL